MVSVWAQPFERDMAVYVPFMAGFRRPLAASKLPDTCR